MTMIVKTINHLGFEVLERPAYSPNLADYYVFRPLQNALQGYQFCQRLWAIQRSIENDAQMIAWLTENLFFGKNTQACGPLD